MKTLNNYFEEAEFNYLGKRTIFLDIDGTLVPDKSLNFDNAVMRQLEKLKKNNRVFLCTNSNDKIRNNQIEKMLGLFIVTHNHKKPSSKIIRELGIDKENKNLLVIGDKFLTDGLFALNIGAQFIKVKRRLSGKESLIIKLINLTDNLAWQIAKLAKII